MHSPEISKLLSHLLTQEMVPQELKSSIHNGPLLLNGLAKHLASLSRPLPLSHRTTLDVTGGHQIQRAEGEKVGRS